LTVLMALLLLLPIAMRYWSKRRSPTVSWTLTGAVFGVVISPVSLGLYSTYFLGPAFTVPGMVGLLLTLFHGAPGYYLCTFLGVVPARTVISGTGNLMIELVSGLVWVLVYGAIGAALDRRSAPRPAL
jgi:hypothetical protein